MAFIELRNVHLKYPLRRTQGITLKEVFIKHVLRRSRSSRQPEPAPQIREVHALRDLSLRIDHGERVGIIGYNGAGKTTLLRTMAGVYPVTSGVRDVQGSICSLLDIGTGFEPDANGWDNIRYCGYFQEETPVTLGPKIREIADFTELGSFMDLPVRCYSAGMSTRLSFAIATSSLPEILFVDEVFGTGDLTFQQKAEARMRMFMEQAKIVVMVGHNLGFLEQFSQRILWLDKGHIRMDGPPKEVVAAYRAEAQKHPIAA